MNAADLIKEFSGMDRLPIDVNDLLPILNRNGHQTDIEFIGVDLDPEILQGKIKIFHIRSNMYGEPKRYANIYYHRGHSNDWKRFICCKELMHILDPDGARTYAADQIEELAEKIGLPPYMQDPTADGFATNVDRGAEFRAAAILLPYRVRELLMPHLQAGKISIADIAVMADIPKKYAGFVMSAQWEKVYELIAG